VHGVQNRNVERSKDVACFMLLYDTIKKWKHADRQQQNSNHLKHSFKIHKSVTHLEAIHEYPDE
jgi:hypothetical protein